MTSDRASSPRVRPAGRGLLLPASPGAYPERAGVCAHGKKRYSERDDALLREMFFKGLSWREMALEMGRTPQGVRYRAYCLGLKRVEFTEVRGDHPSPNTVRNRRYQEKNPEKRRAHKAVEWALSSHTLLKRPCEKCGCTNVDAHHHDYSAPLDVTWLCPRCHALEHRK